jgi:Icc-related predicted phosphoesterase
MDLQSELNATSRMVREKTPPHAMPIPDDTYVLITHEAPYGTLDKTHILARHMGCQYLTGALLRIKPRLHVFGHIHGGYGRESAWDRVTFVHCAVVNNDRVVANLPIVVELAQ